MNKETRNIGWRTIEPTDKSDYIKHQLSSLRKIQKWSILCASVRGKKHAHFGEYREDSFAVVKSGQWAILTVADGAGSVPLARIGSNIATSVIKTTLPKSLPVQVKDIENFDNYQNRDFIDLVLKCLKNAFEKVIDAIKIESVKRKCPVSHLSTTLLVVLQITFKGADIFFWANVGDCIFAVFPTSSTCDILCDEDHGLYGGEVYFITSSGISESIESRIHHISYSNPVNSFVLMTDGVADDLYPLKDRLCDLIEGEIVGKGYMVNAKGGPIKGICHYFRNNKNDAKNLINWLKYDKFGSTYDDRTLIVAMRNN